MTTTVDRSEALVERLFGATIDALELYSIYLGAELGLYAALERDGAPDRGRPAQRAPRYALARAVPRRLALPYAAESASRHGTSACRWL